MPNNVTISKSINIAPLVSLFTELFRAYPGMHLKIHRGSSAAAIEVLKGGEVQFGDCLRAVPGCPAERFKHLRCCGNNPDSPPQTQ